VANSRGHLGRPDVVSSLTLLCVALAAWVGAWALPIGTLHQPGAGFFPRHLTILMAILAILLAIRGCRTDAPPGHRGRRR